ncbi:NmrA family NAD(P)-binding protein [Amycolatopsis sp. K13G38]|uniref:NmrA family NAD(P)-binding protein n=1 Tax=Amycolatopsis acididurans TaxID=2724524 RepID=A0ABX1J564_9PSEU|nr:NmrA family NAD(P)-binding protein [Amycolatopsis acididurans]NKQ53437.1 NmrA family NAD(P)-binding protein [Amycolatopsis acididurans]
MLAFVTGATGQQGGAVARRLLADSVPVRAMTRDPAKAQGLAGAEIVAGGLGDRNAIKEHVRGADVVFFVHPGPLAPDEDESQAARDIADAALEHGVRHLVYSSGMGALGAKADAERIIAGSGVSATVLRPASFMENYLNPLFGLHNGALRAALEPDTLVELIAVDDIAALAALAFADPARFRGRTIELAGDALRPGEIAAAISAALGRTVPYEQMPIDELASINERFAQGYRLLNQIKTPTIDVAALRETHPDLLTFAGWLDKGGAAKIARILDK